MTPFSYLLKKNLDDIPSDYIKGKFQMIRNRLLFSSDVHQRRKDVITLGFFRRSQCHAMLQADQLEKAMATHSSTLAWKIPWTEEPGGLQSMGSLRVRHD